MLRVGFVGAVVVLSLIMIGAGCFRLGFDSDKVGTVAQDAGTDSGPVDASNIDRWSGTDQAMDRSVVVDSPLAVDNSAPKLDSGTTPTLLWSKQFGGAGGDYGSDLLVDASDNLYFTGQFKGSVSFGGPTLNGSGYADIFLVSYTASGGHRWSKRLGGSEHDSGSALAIDGAGNLYLTGIFRDTVDFGGGGIKSVMMEDIFLASFTSLGVYRWARGMGGMATDRGRGVAVDASGNVYATGYFGSTVDFGGGGKTTAGGYDLYLAGYSAATGGYLWAKAMGGSSPDYGQTVAVDGKGNVYVGGQFSGTVSLGGSPLSGTTSTIFVASYDSTGAHRWSKSAGNKSFGYTGAVVVDNSGNLYFTGSANTTVDFGGGPLTGKGGSDVLVASFTSAGTHRWSKRFGGAKEDSGAAVAVDSSGNLYLTGRFQDTASFGSAALTSAGSDDVFVASYTSTGAHRWSMRLGGTGVVHSSGIAADSVGDVYVTGAFKVDADFGEGPVTSAGMDDIFILKLRP